MPFRRELDPHPFTKLILVDMVCLYHKSLPRSVIILIGIGNEYFLVLIPVLPLKFLPDTAPCRISS